MPHRKVRYWRAYLAKCPPLETRLAYYLPQIAAHVINFSPNRKKDSKTLLPSDLDPWFDPWNETVSPVSAQMALMRDALKSTEPEPE